MRLLPGALSAEARRRCGIAERPSRVRVRAHSRGRVLPILSAVLGALVGAIYTHAVTPRVGWTVLATGAVGGACAFYLLLAVPRLTWIVVRRQWLRFALRWCVARMERNLSRAEGAVASAGGDLKGASGEALCDLAVIRCLRNDYEGAHEILRQRYEEDESSAWGENLLVVLAETGQWSQVGWLVDRELNRPEGLSDANLARVATQAPYGVLIERLWMVCQDGSLPLTLNNIGVRLLQLGDFMRAEDAFSLAKHQHPSYAPAYANAGVLAYRRDDYAQAVAEVGSAAALESGEGMIYNNLGAALCRTGNLGLARRWLRRARALLPASGEVLVNLGNLEALEGAYAQALDRYGEASRLEDEGVAAARHNAALMLCARDHPEAALAEQQLAAQAEADEPEIVQNLGCLLWVQGRHDEARSCFEHPSHSTYDTAVKSNLIRTELAAGRPRRALDLLLRVSYAEEEMDFDRGLAYLLTAAEAGHEAGGRDAVRERDLVEAIACFHKVIKAGRAGTAEAYLNLGIALYLSEEYEDAAEALKEASSRAPTHETLGYAIATCYLTAAWRVQRPETEVYGPPPPRMRELLEKAHPYLEAAIGVKSIADNARFNLGVLQYILEDYYGAIGVLRPIARTDSPWQILNVLGISQARQARELQRSMQSAVLVRVTRQRQVQAEIAKLLSAAIHSFTQVLRHQSDNAIVHANVGLAKYLRNRGEDVEQALQHWRRMRDIGGEWGQRIFEIFSDAVGTERAGRLSFQDVEISFRPLPLEDWIVCAPPRMAGLQFPVPELPDIPLPDLVAYHPALKRALAQRDKAERLRKALRRLRT